jgi:hypothetical protein
LHIEKPEDWYKVRLEEVYEYGGAGLLKSKYGDSLIKALIAVYPEYPTRVKECLHQQISVECE